MDNGVTGRRKQQSSNEQRCRCAQYDAKMMPAHVLGRLFDPRHHRRFIARPNHAKRATTRTDSPSRSSTAGTNASRGTATLEGISCRAGQTPTRYEKRRYGRAA